MRFIFLFIPHSFEDLQGSRGEANFAARCKGCSSQMNVNFVPKGVAFLPKKGAKKSEEEYGVVTEEDSEKFVEMIVLEVRGADITNWGLHQTNLKVTSALSNTAFEDVVIEDDEEGFQDVDPETYEQVIVQKIKYAVSRLSLGRHGYVRV